MAADEMTATPDGRVRRLLLAHAREAYVPEWRPSATVPIDGRCPACGVARAGCRSATCIRRVAA